MRMHGCWPLSLPWVKWVKCEGAEPSSDGKRCRPAREQDGTVWGCLRLAAAGLIRPRSSRNRSECLLGRPRSQRQRSGLLGP
jgi:hypothetical protein